MTKRQFIDLLSVKGVKSAIIVSYADWCGGRQNDVVLNTPIEDVRENLSDFAYIEWHGNATDVVRSRNRVFYDTFEWAYQPRQEEPVTLQELVVNKLSK